MEPRIIFDNGGSITLQLPEFAHTYDDAVQCAENLIDWIETEDTSDWEGNDEEAAFEPSINNIRNGGYRVYSIDDLMDATPREIYSNGWGNVRSFYAAFVTLLLN